MDTNNIQQIQNAVSKAQSIGIAVGSHPTVDSMGAALALYLSLQQQGKKVSIASPTDPIVELTSLVGIDRVKRALETDGGDLIVAFPYNDGEIEKVSYTLENGYLNIVVKAGEKGLSFGEQDVEFKHGNGQLDILFVIGTQRLTDLGDVFNPETFKDTTLINIDNKDQNQKFGEIVIVNPQASSVSEVVVSLLSDMGEIDVDTAQNLLNGITASTNNFQSPSVTADTFDAVSMLMRKGAVRRTIQSQPQRVQQDRPQQPQDRRDQRPRFGQRQNQPQNNLTQQNQPRMQPQQVRQPMPQQMQPRQEQPASPVQELQQPPVIDAQAQPVEQSQPIDQTDQRPPSDWLTPKVYKGSSNVQ